MRTGIQKLRKRVTWPVVVALVVVLGGGGTAYAVTTREDTPTYRTVTASTGDVEQTLSVTGLVDAARRADLSFGTDGTVATVKVAQGDTVKAGQVIAVLETEDLDAAVTEAEATLAKAKAQLESDQDAQSSSVEQAVSPSKPTGSSQGSPSGSSNAATAALLKKLKAQQQAVSAAQSTASAALAAAADALAAQTAACADAYQETPSGDATPSDDATPADSADADANAACDAALATVQEKQAAVKEAQEKLADALDALARTLSSALGSVSTPQPSAPSSARTTADTPSADGTSDGTTGGGTVTAARLASDQAQIDQAEADLVSARADRAQATLRSTRSGTVASLDLAKGDRVSTGTSVAVVVGGKAVTLTGTVAESAVDQLKVGQQARISVPGSSTTTNGTLTAIGMTADSTTGSTTYPVTVTVEDPTIALPTGSRAQVAIVVATAQDVVTLPISAVSRGGDGAGSQATVRTWDGTSLGRTPVTLGAVGSRTVAITDGLEAGTEVVVADVDQAITGASSELNQRGNLPGGALQFLRQGGPAGGGPVTVGRAP